MGTDIRTISPEEFEAWIGVLAASFSEVAKPEWLEIDRMIFEPERSLAAIEDGRIVGGNAAITMTLTVPGGSAVRAAGISSVGVLPSDRRRGVSTDLMRRQLDDIRERGEPLSILTASEAAIYGRYGYGIASRCTKLDVEARRAAFVRGYEPQGRMRMVDRSEAETVMLDVVRRTADRPGWVGDPARFQPRRTAEFETWEKDQAPLYAVHEDADGTAGAVVGYRAKHEWPDGIPSVKISVGPFYAATPRAWADTWRFLFDIDLVARVEAWDRPLDDPVFRLMREPRLLRMQIMDGLHLRLVDLPAALEARGYARDGRVVLRVEDRFCPWNEGTWEVVVDGGKATCRPTDSDPEIALSATDLASTYLGDATFRELAHALVANEAIEGAIDRADAVFATSPPPYCWLNF